MTSPKQWHLTGLATFIPSAVKLETIVMRNTFSGKAKGSEDVYVIRRDGEDYELDLLEEDIGLGRFTQLSDGYWSTHY